MKTILHLIPTLEGGGAERQLTMLAVEQVKRGWDVHIVIRRGGLNETKLHDTGVVVHKVGDYGSAHPKLLLSVIMLLRRVKPDLIHTWLLQMDILGGVIATILFTPWIMSERASGLAYKNYPLTSKFRLTLSKNANAVVANSNHGIEYFSKLFPHKKNLFQINNAVDIEAVGNEPPTYCQVGDDPEKKYILSVGRLDFQKGQDILIETINMMKENDNVHFLIIGEGPLNHELKNRIKLYKLDEKVSLQPFQSNWWGMLKTAALIVSTSRFEGSPNVVLEAMAGKCPLIVSDIPEHREILDEKSASFFPVDDAAALADAIVKSLENSEITSKKALRAFDIVRHFTIAATADKYDLVYRKVINKK